MVKQQKHGWPWAALRVGVVSQGDFLGRTWAWPTFIEFLTETLELHDVNITGTE